MHMDKIHETEATVPEMPRFDDGMVNISELMRRPTRRARRATAATAR